MLLKGGTVVRYVVVIAMIGLVAGCGQKEPTRVWKPSDHGQPPEAQVDPSRQPDTQPTAQAQETPQQARADAADAMWRVTCAGCHGDDGRGGGPDAPPGAQMPDMTDPAWQQSKSNRELASVIQMGRGDMPPFGDKVSPAGISALIDHVRGFAAGSATANAGQGSGSAAVKN